MENSFTEPSAVLSTWTIRPDSVLLYLPHFLLLAELWTSFKAESAGKHPHFSAHDISAPGPRISMT